MRTPRSLLAVPGTRLGLGRVLAALWLGLCVAQASAQPAWPPATDAPREGRAWLQRSHDAAAKRNYQGVLVTSVGGQASSARVAHYFEGQQQAERIEPLDGEARGIVRLNDWVHSYWPRSRVMVVEPRDVRARFPSLLSLPDRAVLDAYEWRLLGQERVAGYDADVVLLRARDGLRFSQRLWADRQTGLLLRSEFLGREGQVLESAAFSEVTIGVKPQVEALTQLVRRLDGYKVIRPVSLPVTLESEGWQVGGLPLGFKEVRCARRTLGPADDPRPPVVLHVLYSDGLTDVSLFIEPFAPERHKTRVTAPVGATRALMAKREQHWVTAVGDVPEETLQRFIEALSRR